MDDILNFVLKIAGPIVSALIAYFVAIRTKINRKDDAIDKKEEQYLENKFSDINKTVEEMKKTWKEDIEDLKRTWKEDKGSMEKDIDKNSQKIEEFEKSYHQFTIELTKSVAILTTTVQSLETVQSQNGKMLQSLLEMNSQIINRLPNASITETRQGN